MRILKIISVILAVLILLFVSVGLIYPDFEYGNSVTIQAPQQTCWNTYHDTTNQKQWMKGFESLTLIQGEHMTPGAVYEIIIKEEGGEPMVMTEKLVALEEPQRITYELSNDVLTSKYTFSFEERGSQTIVTSHYHVRGNNIFMQSLLFLSKSYFNSEDRELLEELKKFIESKS
ncbi:MAG: SRPBCC family protein [Bacteroidota bacterium]